MKPVFEHIEDGKLVGFTPTDIQECFEAIRTDWEDCYSSMLGENFVILFN